MYILHPSQCTTGAGVGGREEGDGWQHMGLGVGVGRWEGWCIRNHIVNKYKSKNIVFQLISTISNNSSDEIKEIASGSCLDGSRADILVCFAPFYKNPKLTCLKKPE